LTHSLAGKRRGTILYAFDLLERDWLVRRSKAVKEVPTSLGGTWG
jgi:hypothetical protein